MMETANQNSTLIAPGHEYWLGTDLAGNSIAEATLKAFMLEIATVVVVGAFIYWLGLLIARKIAYHQGSIPVIVAGMLQTWAMIPALLVGILLLVHLGWGQLNVILVLIFLFTPTQSLVALEKILNETGEDYVLAKLSYGFTWSYIIDQHVTPNIKSSYRAYTLSRLPEVVLADLAFNFLGIGAQPPWPSLGGLLFDGLGFMASAWWIWLPSVVSICLLIFIVVYLHERIGVEWKWRIMEKG